MFLGLVDWSFIITVGVILLGTLLGSYLRAARKDRCLEDFDGFHVTVEKKDNRVIWGTMHLHPTGFELIYRSDVQDDQHLETSYILYRDEFQDLQAIYRYERELSEDKRQQRARDLQRSFHPGIVRRLLRGLRNFLNTATDSLAEVVGLMIGRVRKPAAHLITETSETYLKDIGKNIIGYAGTSYDSLLEHYVGTRVVVEMVEDDEVHEHVGVLKDYSADFLEVLDVYYPLPQQIRLQDDVHCDVVEQVEVSLEERQLRVSNHGHQPVFVERISLGDQDKQLDAIVAGGEQITLHVDRLHPETMLHLRVACRLDMIVPRSHALIRHRAERYDPDTIFDIGLAIVRRQGDAKEVERLRQVLRYTPHDAMSAAKLGELLFTQGEMQEAVKWLGRAYEYRRYLPDNGNRVSQNLRLLQRRAGNAGRSIGANGSEALTVAALSAASAALKAADSRDPAFQIAISEPSAAADHEIAQ